MRESQEQRPEGAEHDRTAGLLAELGWVRGLARGLVRDASVAEDLVQETCLAVIAAKGESLPMPRGYLRVVLKNAARQRARSESARRRREEQTPERPTVPSPEELALRMERQRQLSEAILALDEPFRSTVILRYLEGLEPVEIARRLGIPAATVRGRLKTALERLRLRLDRTFEGDRRSWAVALLPLLDLESAWIWEVVGAKAGLVAGVIAMKKTVLVACLIVLAAGALGVNAALRSGLAPAARTPAEADVARATPPPTATGTTAGVASQSAAADGNERRIAGAPDVAPARIAGRVFLPPGCDLLQPLEVVALEQPTRYADYARRAERAQSDPEEAQRLAKQVLARASVAGDGHFELTLPNGVTRAHLLVRGRNAYTPETRASEAVAGEHATEIELGALGGGWITGRLTGGDPTGTRVALLGREQELSPSSGVVENTFVLETKSGSDGRFAFHGLPLERNYDLLVLPPELAAMRAEVGAVGACAAREVELALQTGERVRGRVVDPAGAPVAGAAVEALFQGRYFGLDDRLVRSAESDADGRFELAGVPAGRIVLCAKAPGRLESEKRPLDLAPGAPVDGVELVLGDVGGRIAGRVLRPGGTPAAGATIEVAFDRAFLIEESTLGAQRGASGSAVADAAGRFEVAGLGVGPFSVRATLPDALEASRDNVQPGTTELELALHAPFGLRGSVLQANGAPLTRFTLHAVRIVDGGIGRMGTTRLREELSDSRGEFVFTSDELVDGDWELWAEAPGLVMRAPASLALPADAARPIVLALEPAATVSGHVLRADGSPAAGASVRMATSMPAWASAITPGREPAQAICDGQGHFQLDGLVPEPIALQADAEDAAQSAAVEIQLAAGVVMQGIVLTLGDGATVTGEAFAATGAPAAGDMIYLEREDKSDMRFVAADSEGRFALHHLEPGSWTVTAIAPGAASQETSIDTLIGSLRMALVTLEEGAHEHVVLGAPPAEPVRVHGLVTSGGAPRAGGWVLFFPTTGGGPQRMKFAIIGRDGRYEVNVDAPGDYSASVNLNPADPKDERTADFVCRVSRAPSFQLDLALPTGRISGRVVGARGAPAAGARVTVVSEGKDIPGDYSVGYYEEVVANADGRYKVSGLRPGTYWIAAGGPASAADAPSYARVLREGIVLGSAPLEDVDFELPEPGALVVRTRGADGTPLAGAALFVRNEAGRIVDALSAVVTDENGQATYTGLAPGSYSVCARVGLLASEESASVRVLAGEEQELTLRLASATHLTIELRDAAGDAVNGWAYVFDEKEREVGGLYHAAEVEALFMRGAFAPSAPIVGPLPAGRYRIDASAPGGRKATRELTLNGEPERRLVLEL